MLVWSFFQSSPVSKVQSISKHGVSLIVQTIALPLKKKKIIEHFVPDFCYVNAHVCDQYFCKCMQLNKLTVHCQHSYFWRDSKRYSRSSCVVCHTEIAANIRQSEIRDSQRTSCFSTDVIWNHGIHDRDLFRFEKFLVVFEPDDVRDW